MQVEVNGKKYDIEDFNDYLVKTVLFSMKNKGIEETGNIFNNTKIFKIENTEYVCENIGILNEKNGNTGVIANLLADDTKAIKELSDTLDTLMTEIIPNMGV